MGALKHALADQADEACRDCGDYPATRRPGTCPRCRDCWLAVDDFLRGF